MKLLMFASLVALSAFTVSAEAPSVSFCHRLAPQLAMKPVTVGPRAGPTLWRVDTRSLGARLFGAGAVTRIGLRPIDPTVAAEYVRLDKLCDTTAKGAICHIEGPARLTIGTAKVNASVDATSGERAEAEVKGSVITCVDTKG